MTSGEKARSKSATQKQKSKHSATTSKNKNLDYANWKNSFNLSTEE